MRKTNEKFIAPPADVHLVLLCHLMDKNFVHDQRELFGKNICHKATYLPTVKFKNGIISVKYTEPKSIELWQMLYPSEPFDKLSNYYNNQPRKKRYNRPNNLEKRIVKIIMDNWEMQTGPMWKIYLPHFKSIQYLYCSFLRYQMLLRYTSS